MPDLTLATAEERDALPVGVVVRSAVGTIACRLDGRRGLVFGDERPFSWVFLQLPLTLLYHPDRDLIAEAKAEERQRIAAALRKMRDEELGSGNMRGAAAFAAAAFIALGGGE